MKKAIFLAALLHAPFAGAAGPLRSRQPENPGQFGAGESRPDADHGVVARDVICAHQRRNHAPEGMGTQPARRLAGDRRLIRSRRR